MHPTTKLQWNFLLLLLMVIMAKNPLSPLQCLFSHTKTDLPMVFFTNDHSLYLFRHANLSNGRIDEGSSTSGGRGRAPKFRDVVTRKRTRIVFFRIK